MTDEESRSLLGEHVNSSSRQQALSIGQQRRSFEVSSESTPLLHRRDDDLSTYGGIDVPRASSPTPGIVSPAGKPKRPRKKIGWTLICGLLAVGSIISILILAFIAPAVVKRYVREATLFKPTNLSVESATSEGVRARIQGDVVLDANRLGSGSVRNIGRFVTWIGREVETGQSEVYLYLPEYGNALVGSASLPSIKINIRNGHVNHLDFEADLVAGNVEGLRSVAVDWLEGKLDRLLLKGSADLHLKSGLLSLGEQTLDHSVVLEEDDFPSLPAVDITKFNVHDVDSPDDEGAMAVDISVSTLLGSPFSLRIPPLGFKALVANCSPRDPYISVADVVTKEIAVTPAQSTVVDVSGIIRGLSDELTANCPGETRSPLDTLLTSYIHGSQTIIYVRGADVPSLGTPQWMTDILKTVTLPLSFTGHALDNLIKNFTMTNVHFTLPNPMAEPDSPDARPTVSALVKVLISVPEQMDFDVEVPRVRAKADVYYHKDKLGILDLKEWQPANSTLIRDLDNTTVLQVKFPMDKAPLEVTDEDVLTDVLSSLIFEGKSIRLMVSANVDAEISTGLGAFAVRGIPADGKLTVNPPFGGSPSRPDGLKPQVQSLELGTTTETSLLVNTMVNFTNPTEYSASVPFLDLLIVYNATSVAHITAKDVTIVPGTNAGVNINLQWDPLDLGGPSAVLAGQDLISRFVSGLNTSVTMKTHQGTVPALPRLGQALSRLGFEVQMPKLTPVGNPDGDPGQPGRDDGHKGFIQDATLHLWSSTAEFALFSPLNHTILEITSIEAQAFYEHDHEVGAINYYTAFSIPPGLSHSPRLPVELNLSGIGYDAVKRAVGGTLDLDTVAKVGVRIENYNNTVNYHGKGIKAKVKL
ncbi:uncharacterized protein DSM5745_11536 [Aspergillus mulundensis]|uniref:Pre-rRNA processing protein n=1 Tax=Aspergillus mulundensis TaxID=1810919 RepID=A0A3D8Q669_9EURO|nr:Uncharacterized protein DSM5745_11536 [Aspergillus mulundensis]RDW57138.1 Uncharacterized protein DSM5745_11536 [Aspergillus mulundensis]